MKRFQILFLVLLLATVTLSTRAQERPILRLDTGGHMAAVTMMVFSPDGQLLYTASEDKTVRVWDVETGECLRVLRGWLASGHEGKLYAIDISPDGRVLALGGVLSGYDFPNTSIRLIDPQTGQMIQVLREHGNVIYNVKFSPDGKWLASSSGDQTVKVWPVEDLGRDDIEPKFTLNGHTGDIYGLAWSPDGASLLSSGNDGRLILWNTASGEIRHEARRDSPISRCAFSPDGSRIITGEDGGAVLVWNAESLEVEREIVKVDEGDLSDVAYSPGGQVIACGGSYLAANDGVWTRPVFLYNPLTGEQKGTFYMHTNTIQGIAFSPNGRWIATAGGNDSEIWIWNADSQLPLHMLKGQGQTLWASAFGLNVAGIFWGVINEGKNLQSGNPITGGFSLSEMRPMRWSEVEQAGIKSTYHEVDGKTIEAPGVLYQPELTIAGNKIDWPYEADTITCYTFTPDGKYAIVGSEFALVLFDAETGERLGFFSGHEGGIRSIGISPDGRLLLSGSKDQTLKLWKIDSRQLVASFFFAQDREWVVWTESGYYAASAQGDKYVGWHLNGETNEKAEFYHAEQFRPIFNRPDVVKQTIFLGSEELGLARANALIQRAEEKAHPDRIQQIRPPEITIAAPADGTFTREGSVFLRYKIDSVREVRMVRVTVNGKMLDKTRELGQSVLKKDEGIIEVPLDAGLNRLTVFATHDLALSRKKVRIRRIGEDEAAPGAMRPGKLYVVAIGVDKYPNLPPKNQLDFTDDDAREIAAAMARLKGRLFADVEVRLLDGNAGEYPTAKTLHDALGIFSKAGIQDTCVLFIAGHGITTREGTYFFVPRDAEKLQSGALNLDTMVHWQTIRQALDVPGRKMMLVDTCHAAAASGSGSSQQNINPDELFKILQDDSTVIMTASRSTEKSAENPRWGHGAFTKCLLEGLREKEADITNDNLISIEEIDNYVSKAVPKLTDNKQNPITFAPLGGESLIIYK
ncbi:MAG: caspase family protein [Candidatus Sumerlaeia bacterium]